MALERERQLAGGGRGAGHEAGDGAGQLAGDQQVAVAQGDVAALVVEPGAQLGVVERHQRAGGHDDPRAAQSGGRDEQRAVTEHDAPARAVADRVLADERLDLAVGPQQRDDAEDERAGQRERGEREHGVGERVAGEAPAHHAPNSSSGPVTGR